MTSLKGTVRFFAYAPVVQIDGWRRFFTKLNIDPDQLVRVLESYETLKDAEEEDELKPLHAAFTLCAVALPAATPDPLPKKTPLDDFLAKPDATYACKLVR